MELSAQIVWLFILPIPVACIAWTITHEEIFREAREYCSRRSVECKSLGLRKFFYVFTCEYCFSHYITILALILTDYKLFLDDWRWYVLAGFSIVWIANIYMSVYAFIRIDIKKERIITKIQEQNVENEE